MTTRRWMMAAMGCVAACGMMLSVQPAGAAETSADPNSVAPSTPSEMLAAAGSNAKSPGTAQGTPQPAREDLFEAVTGIDLDETPLIQIGAVAAINTFFDWLNDLVSAFLGGLDLTPGFRLGL